MTDATITLTVLIVGTTIALASPLLMILSAAQMERTTTGAYQGRFPKDE